MKPRIVLILISVLLSSTAFSESDTSHYELVFDQANEAYKIGAYDSAKSLYNSILSSGLTSPDLLYNLGNAHYKIGNISSALLYYERAHKMSPWDTDIQHNLLTARSQTADKMDKIRPIFYLRWYNALAGLMHSTAWGWMIIALIALTCVLFGIFYLSQSPIFKQLTLIGTISLVALITLSCFLGYQAHGLEQEHEAIVFASSVNVKSEPSSNSTVLFVVHEGLKIEVLQENDDWVRVKFENGNTGWLPSQSIETI